MYYGVSMFGKTAKAYATEQDAIAAMNRKLKAMMRRMKASGQLPEARAVKA